MKIKELLDFNPEAEITIVSAKGTPFEGKLTYGWSHGSGESIDKRKETATEVCIFLGDISENSGKA